MKLKKVFTGLLLLAVGFIVGSAFTSTSYKPEYMNITFRKRIAVKPSANGTPDTNALVQIGDMDSSGMGLLRFPAWTDTSTVRIAGHAKRGVVIFSYRDSCLWIHTGARWKKLGD